MIAICMTNTYVQQQQRDDLQRHYPCNYPNPQPSQKEQNRDILLGIQRAPNPTLSTKMFRDTYSSSSPQRLVHREYTSTCQPQRRTNGERLQLIIAGSTKQEEAKANARWQCRRAFRECWCVDKAVFICNKGEYKG